MRPMPRSEPRRKERHEEGGRMAVVGGKARVCCRLGLRPDRVGSETQPTWLRPQAALGVLALRGKQKIRFALGEANHWEGSLP